MALSSIFIVSVPRSGSTLLTNLLDVHEDVICPPETFFPGVLNCLRADEMKDRRTVAALFVVSSSDGSPLTLQEAERCIHNDKQETLDSLALAIAAKLGRDPESIRIAVWKFTRMVGCWDFAASIGGKFIIIRRNLLNVYESQFRVPFGEKNKNPVRFALFAASYDAAFSGYPKDRTLEIGYPEIPEKLDMLVTWTGSSGVRRLASTGSLDSVADRNPWHSNINKPFKNQDAEKVRNLTKWQASGFKITYAIIGSLGFLSRMARKAADERQMASLRQQAAELLNNPKQEYPAP
jgi:hypothetical protein